MHRVVMTMLVAAAMFAAAACHDEGPQLPTEQPRLSRSTAAPTPTQIRAQIDALFPAGRLRIEAHRRFSVIEGRMARQQLQGARTDAISLIDFTLDQFYAGRLLDPRGFNPPTRQRAVVDLVCSLLQFVRLACPIPPGASLQDVRLGVVGPDGGVVVARLGGIRIPPGSLQQDVLFVVRKLPDPTVPRTGPLPTTLDQYKFFYDISATPKAIFFTAATVGLCQLDIGANAFAPPSRAVYNRLRIAHPNPANPRSIVLETRVPAPFVNCNPSHTQSDQGNLGFHEPGLAPAWRALGDLASRALRLVGPRPLYANHVPVGGTIRSLSPFGAVDPIRRATGSGATPGSR